MSLALPTNAADVWEPVPDAQPDHVWDGELKLKWQTDSIGVKNFTMSQIMDELQMTKVSWERFSADIETFIAKHFKNGRPKAGKIKDIFLKVGKSLILHWQAAFNIPTPDGHDVSPRFERMVLDWAKHRAGRIAAVTEKERTKSKQHIPTQGNARFDLGEETTNPSRSAHAFISGPTPQTQLKRPVWLSSLPLSPPSPILPNNASPIRNTIAGMDSSCVVPDLGADRPVMPSLSATGVAAGNEGRVQLLIRDEDNDRILINISDVQLRSMPNHITIANIDVNKVVKLVIKAGLKFDPSNDTLELIVGDLDINGMQVTIQQNIHQLVQAAYNMESSRPCVFKVARARKLTPWLKEVNKRQASSFPPDELITDIAGENKRRKLDATNDDMLDSLTIPIQLGSVPTPGPERTHNIQGPSVDQPGETPAPQTSLQEFQAVGDSRFQEGRKTIGSGFSFSESQDAQNAQDISALEEASSDSITLLSSLWESQPVGDAPIEEGSETISSGFLSQESQDAQNVHNAQNFPALEDTSVCQLREILYQEDNLQSGSAVAPITVDDGGEPQTTRSERSDALADDSDDDAFLEMPLQLREAIDAGELTHEVASQLQELATKVAEKRRMRDILNAGAGSSSHDALIPGIPPLSEYFKVAIEEAYDRERQKDIANHVGNVMGEEGLPSTDILMKAASFENQYLLEQLTEEHWLDTCRLFRLDPQNKGVQKVQCFGLTEDLLISQAIAITWMLKQRVTIGGGIIADEQGLGKTRTALVFCLFISRLERLHMHWGRYPQQHSSNGATCSIKDKYYLFACPCEKDPPLWVQQKPEGAQVLIVLPANIAGWIREFTRTFAKNRLDPGRLRLVVGHGTADYKQSRIASGDVKLVKLDNRIATEMRPFTGDDGLYRVSAGNCANVVLTTVQSFEARVYKALFADGTSDRCWFSSIIIDEMHQNKSKNCRLHSVILKRQVDQEEASMFAMSGTPLESGPKDIHEYVNWWIGKWEVQAKACEERDLVWDMSENAQNARNACQMEKLERLQTRLNNLSRAKGAPSPEEIAKVGSELCSTLSNLEIRRKKRSRLLNGQNIINLSELEVKSVTLEPSDEYGRKLNEMANNFFAELSAAYRARLKTWFAKGQRGPRPEPTKGNFFQKSAWLRPMIVFPALIELNEKEFPSGWNVAIIEANKWFDENNSENPFFKHWKMLYKSSVRCQHIVQFYKQLIEKWEKCERDGTNMPNGENRKPKMVVMSQSPAVTVAVYACMKNIFRGKHVVKLYNAAKNDAERNDMVDGFQEAPKYSPDSGLPTVDANGKPIPRVPKEHRADILIGSTWKLGTGHNLDRACYLFLTEPQQSNTDTEQATNRIHRVRQQFGCQAFILCSNNVDFEQTCNNRLMFRAAITNAVDDATLDEELQGEINREMEADELLELPNMIA